MYLNLLNLLLWDWEGDYGADGAFTVSRIRRNERIAESEA